MNGYGHDNPTFVGDSVYTIPGEFRRSITQFYPGKHIPAQDQNYPPPAQFQVSVEKIQPSIEKQKDIPPERDSWGKGIEFLMSCIAMSVSIWTIFNTDNFIIHYFYFTKVGLGNIWRFPFIALKNGGGAFVIPYIIVLLLVGKPIYFMEMVFGQFSSRGSVKVFDCVPAMRGVGVGQVVSIAIVATYYSSIMAVTLQFLFSSFSSVLPWSQCKPEWGSCIPSGASGNMLNVSWTNTTKSSAELYFTYVFYSLV